MIISKSKRAALLAAASLTAAGLASGALAADAAYAPTLEEVVVTSEPLEPAVFASPAEPERQNRMLMLSAAAAATLALIGHLIGWRTIRRNVAAAGPHMARAARAAAAAPATAARAIGRKMSSPLRALLIFASLVTAAFIGVGFYDVEWLGGLIVGAAMVIAGTRPVTRMRSAFARVMPDRQPQASRGPDVAED